VKVGTFQTQKEEKKKHLISSFFLVSHLQFWNEVSLGKEFYNERWKKTSFEWKLFSNLVKFDDFVLEKPQSKVLRIRDPKSQKVDWKGSPLGQPDTSYSPIKQIASQKLNRFTNANDILSILKWSSFFVTIAKTEAGEIIQTCRPHGPHASVVAGGAWARHATASGVGTAAGFATAPACTCRAGPRSSG